MAKKKQNIPAYGTAEINGVTYFRTRITDADGKRVPFTLPPVRNYIGKSRKLGSRCRTFSFGGKIQP